MKQLSFIMLIAILAISCKEKKSQNTEETHSEHQEKHWTYEGETGPEHWDEIEANSDCNGMHQSPINIIEIDAKIDAELQPLDIHYSDKVKIHEVTNNGHSIQYNFEEGDFINLNNEQYDLKQIHFHEGSEHTLDGVRYPLEIHLVHLNKDKEIAVLSILVKEGENSEPFTFLEQYLPVKAGETKEINEYFDINLNLPSNKSYFAYSGSLTTPPCTENVSWFVFKNPITVSLEQVKILQALMPINNYRTEQPINDRVISLYSAN
ncbi:carbonic anhydrase family protein [Lutibacter sp. HS1-25]|uniref:carbonic anhydrase n=1 Tax=Lutibacter sp. HS1-25 TaxID=2485000 RepID=UPI0010135D5B|nr:carbonic anhydrase family protein [Lutibacter sp. HS1-25]RXP54265.1 carbonic anhydrase family protein [Lutibacter sp. HS1-25]